MLDMNPQTRITVDEILRNPWFIKGYREVKIQHRELDWEENRSRSLNAFDLISFSTGFDMCGLFTDPEVSDCVERIVSGQTPERIMEKVEEVAKAERVTVRKEENGCRAKLEGQDGNPAIMIGIYRLTDELVVVEMKRRETQTESVQQFWTHKLRPQLLELVYKPEAPVMGGSK